MRAKQVMFGATVVLSVAAVLSGCANAGEAQSFAERDVAKVKAAIEPATRDGVQFTVTAESSCSEGCSGVVVVEQTAGELRVSDVLALHNALRDIQLSRKALWGNRVVLQVPDQYRMVPFEAGFCTTGGGAFRLRDEPNPECIPRTATPTPSP
jgi:hypothetical protein